MESMVTEHTLIAQCGQPETSQWDIFCMASGEGLWSTGSHLPVPTTKHSIRQVIHLIPDQTDNCRVQLESLSKLNTRQIYKRCVHTKIMRTPFPTHKQVFIFMW